MNNIGAIALQEKDNFLNKSIQLTDGGSFNQHDTIKRIIRYNNNEFWNCNDPDALFYQIANNRRALYAKSIDMDSKAFKAIGVGKTNWYQSWIINVRFKKWIRDERFPLILDDVADDVSNFGSSVWKKTYNPDGTVGIECCDLRNLYFDPTVKNIIDSPVVEMHYMTESEIRNRWPDKVDEIIEQAERGRDEENNTAESEDDKYKVIERWGEYDGEYRHYVGVAIGENAVDIVNDEVKINKRTGKPKTFPYFDFHGEKVKGRWLGIGVTERLFHIQEQVNTLVNQNNEVNNIASMILFRTADPNTTGNVINDVQNGQIFNSEDMQEMAISNRFLQGFISQLQQLERKADELCYVTESIAGDTPPSGVPFRSLAVATRGSVSTFNYIKSSMGEKMGYILQEEIFPSLVKKWNLEDTIEIMEDEGDIRLYNEAKINQAMQDFIKEKTKKGMVVFRQDLEVIKEQMRAKIETGKKDEVMGKNFFDFEYGIVMNPTGETIDKGAQNNAIDAALSQMFAAPAVVNTPLFKQKLENNNIPPFRLTMEEQRQIQESKTGAPMPSAPQDTLSDKAAI